MKEAVKEASKAEEEARKAGGDEKPVEAEVKADGSVN